MVKEEDSDLGSTKDSDKGFVRTVSRHFVVTVSRTRGVVDVFLQGLGVILWYRDPRLKQRFKTVKT